MELSLYPSITKEEWNRFVFAHGGSFLQSWEWGEFQKKFGHGVTRVTVREGRTLLLIANIVHFQVPLKIQYWYVPYGPVYQRGSGELAFGFFTQEMRRMVPANVAFLKIEPDIDTPPLPEELGFTRSPKSVQATETMIMDLSQSEARLLAHMKQKTRYNVRLAERHGVKIVSPEEQGALDPSLFVSLLQETARRNGFRLHPESYYREMMALYLSGGEQGSAPAFSLRLFFAQYEDTVVASALVGFFGNRATFLHGASSETHKNVMAPYLLHWEIMRHAKARGFTEYDLWGVVTERTPADQRAKWEGFSRFKLGFGGRVAEYPGAHDLPLNRIWYTFYRTARSVRALTNSWRQRA